MALSLQGWMNGITGLKIILNSNDKIIFTSKKNPYKNAQNCLSI